MTTIRTANRPLAIAAPGKALNIALWTLQVLVALAFVAAGSGKLLGSSEMIALFDAVGIGQWFRYVTGSLEVLLNKGPQSVSEIGRRVDLTSGSITTAIDRLEQRGLVARAAHASDRRARVVDLTSDGKARITHVFARHEDAMDRAAHGLSKAERGTLIELLKKLGTTAERQLTEGDGES